MLRPPLSSSLLRPPSQPFDPASLETFLRSVHPLISLSLLVLDLKLT